MLYILKIFEIDDSYLRNSSNYIGKDKLILAIYGSDWPESTQFLFAVLWEKACAPPPKKNKLQILPNT